MTNFTELIEKRYSVRKFKDVPLAEGDIEKILHAACVAPTGCNYQPQRIFVVKSAEAVAKLKECTRCHFNAPNFMLVCYKTDECWYRPYDKAPCGPIDASIVATHMMLRAAEIGVGTCWVMHFNPAKLKERFALPADIEPVALLVMGYPADDAAPMNLHYQFRPQEEMVRYL